MISATAEQIRLFFQFGPITIKSILAKIEGFSFEVAAVFEAVLIKWQSNVS